MNDIVKQWMVDAEAYELQKIYKVNGSDQFEFYKRQGDFYITLLNRMYNILQEIEDTNYESKRDDLTDIAHAMLIYSEQRTENDFSGVDKASNQLYVAAIYFLIGYEAIASILLKRYDICAFPTESAKLIFYIVSGSAYKIQDISDSRTRDLIRRVRSFLLTGNSELESIHEEIERKFKFFSFESLDDFFDTAVLVHVLRKFCIHNLWSVLLKYDSNTDWADYIRHSKKQHILSFLPSQEDAISKGLLSFKKAFSLKMPTSAGKSYITELLIYQEIRNNPDAKILYLAPLRSLSRELKDRYIKVGRALGFTTRAIYGGSTYTIDQSILDEVQLLISTPETFTTLEETMEEKLRLFSLVICDEGQLLDSLSRGINYELLLTRLKKIDNIRYLFLSAIIPNIEDVNTWLGGGADEVGDSQYRPCPIKLSHIGDDYNLYVKDSTYENDLYVIKKFISDDERKGIGGSQKSLSVAVALKSIEAGPVLLFTTSKSGRSGCLSIGDETLKLINKGHLSAPLAHSEKPQRLSVVSEYIKYQFGNNHPLGDFILKGFAYHHGSLPQDIREIIEQSYIDKTIPLLICTNTLAEGVNMPVQTLVLYNISRYDASTQTTRSIDITEIKNIVGRAGRAGRQRFGVVVYIGDPSKDTFTNTKKALQNKGLHKIMGTLYDVVRVFTRNRNQIDDADVNRILEEYGLAAAIDTMITRSLDISSLEDIDVEEIVKESLAYHVGNESIREDLKRVFRIRHAVIKSKINNDNFEAYHSTGLSIDDIAIVEKKITLEALDDIEIYNPLSSSWLDFVVEAVSAMPSFQHGRIQCHDEKEYRDLNEVELKKLISIWVSGSQYYEIATELDCEVENAIELVMYLQNLFHMSVSSLVRYIQHIGGDVTALSQWVDMIKYGVDKYEKLLFIKSGLTDRIVVNSLLNTQIVDILNFEKTHALRQSLLDNRESVLKCVDHLQLPVLCKERVAEYLN